MKRYILTVTAALTLLLSAGTLGAQAPDYDTYFTPDRLRVDFILAGDEQEQHAYLAGLKKECAWAGSHASLIDPFRYGEYMFEAWSGETLIYSKGFSTLFQEWRTTAEAREVSKAYTQAVWMPFPKEDIRITLSERVKATGEFREIFSCSVDPEDALISSEAAPDAQGGPALRSRGLHRRPDGQVPPRLPQVHGVPLLHGAI